MSGKSAESRFIANPLTAAVPRTLPYFMRGLGRGNHDWRTHMSFHYQHDWLDLTGEFIQVRRAGILVDQGYVDAVMPDGSALWLRGQGINRRRMLLRFDENEVWIN